MVRRRLAAAGRYPMRIELPQPAFNNGYTSVPALTLTRFDVNGDGARACGSRPHHPGT